MKTNEQSKHAKKGEGFLQKRGRVFHAVWYFRGRRYSVSTRETDERAARKRLAEIVANFQREHDAEAVLSSVKESLQRAQGRTLRIADAWAVYEHDKTRRAVAPETLRHYKLRFGVFARWASGKVENIDDVTPQVAQAFMAHVAETASGKTYGDYLSGLSMTWRTFIKSNFATENPWTFDKSTGRGIERLDKDTHRKSELTPSQLDALFTATGGGEMRLLFFVGLFTGLRLKDCALLKWESIDLPSGFIRLTPEKTKRHGIAVTIPILPPLADALNSARRDGGEAVGYVMPELAETYLSGAVEGRNLSKHISTVFRRAGIETTVEAEGRCRRVTDFGFHSLRHCFISICERAGIRQSVVREIVGHTSDRITERYTHTNETDLAAAMAAFPAIALAGTESPQERAGDGEGMDTPERAADTPRRNLEALSRLLADMNAGELEEAAKMIAQTINNKMEVPNDGAKQ